MNKVIINLVLISIFLSVAFAARPFSVESGTVLAQGAELKMGYAGSTAGESKQTQKTIAAKLSLIPNVLEGSYSRKYIDAQNNPWGNGDSELAAKYAVTTNQTVKAVLGLPDGDAENGFGKKYTTYALTYALEGQLPDSEVNYYANFGYTLYSSPGDWWADHEVQNHFLAGLGLRFPVLSDVALCFEATKWMLVREYNNDRDGYVNGMFGVVWTARKDIALDLSYRSQPEKHDFTYALGATFKL